MGGRGHPGRRSTTPNEPQPDWRQGYGFQFWMARHGYRGDGAYGQFCVVLPEQDVVIATTAATGTCRASSTRPGPHLLPAMTDSTVEAPLARVARKLTDRLSGSASTLPGAALPALVGAGLGGSVVRSGRTVRWPRLIPPHRVSAWARQHGGG